MVVVHVKDIPPRGYHGPVDHVASVLLTNNEFWAVRIVKFTYIWLEYWENLNKK